MTTKACARREFLKLTGAAAAGLAADAPAQEPGRRPKKIVVAGGGIGGLCAGFELRQRGHDVTLLEASGRPGGHVRTIHDPLPAGLYADVGAEHITRPGYDQVWRYVKEFNLPVLRYPRRDNVLRRLDGRWYTEEQLRDAKVLMALGLNARETDYAVKNGLNELPVLYLGQYLERFKDEYQPFGVGLDKLDEKTVGELLVDAGASDAGLRFSGARRGDGAPAARASQHSALYRVWQMAIVRHRRLAHYHRELYRIRGGNQILTDTFASRLGDRVRLGCPVRAIDHGKSGVTVHFTEHGDKKQLEADYLVSALPMNILRNIPVTPKWPEAKDHAIRNVVFSSQARVVFQCRTPFWKKELASVNLEFGDASLNHVWATADEVPGERAILLGVAQPKASAAEALAALRRLYPGKAAPTVEQALVHNWANDPWSSWCERLPFPLGQLRRYWPHLMEPVGRIHFAGAHADNLPWGMDAATRSANRVARAIDES